ncbi:MAG: RnfABCDGE type electron transport complex subunit C [Bacilli bacterium]
MNKPIHIDGDDKMNYGIEIFKKPEFIYIPLEDRSGNKYKLEVKEGDYVYKESVVAIREDINFPISSSVSGYVRGETSKVISNGKKVKCIIIENDFKEKSVKKSSDKDISLSRDKFIDMLRESGITGLGGSDYPTFLKYKNTGIKYLLVNAVECEPFITCDKAIINSYAEEILEAMDDILEIMDIAKGIIVIKKTDENSNTVLKKYIGTYPNISIKCVEDAYPNGWERLVVKNALGIEYNKYPTEEGIIVSNVSTIYAIYEMLKYHNSLTERTITIAGPGIKNKKNIKVKIGTLASDVIANIDDYKEIKNPLLIAGGPMMGNSISTDDIVITRDLNSILVIEDYFEKNLPCIKCGKCINVCPVGIYPVLIMENKDSLNNIKDLMLDKCIECGLCSYICPSKIEVREYVRIAKEKVKK